MIIAVIDGMGGSIGHQVIASLRKELPLDTEIIALATNAVAVNHMLKAGANRGASGENAICVSIKEAGLILGPLAIVIPNSMMGELTPKMAQAISDSPAEKILLPLTYPKINLIGTSNIPVPHLMEEALKIVKQFLGVNS